MRWTRRARRLITKGENEEGPRVAENSEKKMASRTAEAARAEFLVLEEQLRAAEPAYDQADGPEIGDAVYCCY